MTRSRKRVLILVGVACVAVAPVPASTFTYTSPSFDLGPGETAFGLLLNQFDPSAHPEAPVLKQVQVTLQATFGGNVELFGLPSAPTDVHYQLSSALIVATPDSPGLLAPAEIALSLTGTQNVGAGSSVSITSQASGSTARSATDAGSLAQYQGAGTVAYDVDFSALYPQLITTAPAKTSGLLCSDRVMGQLVVQYSADPTPPTAVVLESFAAIWTQPNRVMVTWQTGVETDVAGFNLERQAGDGTWLRVNESMIAALGGSQPNTYGCEDLAVPLSGSPLNYRLLLVTSEGEQTVAVEAATQRGIRLGVRLVAGGVELGLSGVAGSQVVIDRSGSLAPGSWLAVGSVQLDATGQATRTLTLDPGLSARFYRARLQ